MSRILITGANSFVGSNFRRFSRFKDIDEISLLDNSLENIKFNRYDVVLHVAAIVHQSKRISEKEYFTVNRDLCLQVAENARKEGVKQFIFLSTLKVYGDYIPEIKIRNEDSTCYPIDTYGKSKLAAEICLRRLETPDFIVSVVRTPLVYGEGVKANMMRLIKLIEMVPILPFKDVSNKRNYNYAGNLSGFIDQIIIKKASGVFIAMDENAISTTELVKLISHSFDKKVFLFRVPKVLIRMACFFSPQIIESLFYSMEFDNSNTLKILDYKAPFSTEEGLNKMVRAYKNRKKS